jgi:hypothetical protein
MTDKKISALTDLGGAPASTDVLPIVDSSANQTKKVSVEDLFTNPNVTGTLTADGLTVEGSTTTNINGSNYTFSGTNYDIHLLVGSSGGGVRLGQDSVTRNSVIGTTGTNALDIVTYNGSAWGKRARFDNTGDISFYEDTGTTAKFFWDASAESLGIGTSSPARNLEVHSSTGGNAYISAKRDNATSTEISIGAENGNTAITSIGAIPMAFYTNGSEAMRIDASGNLLVGTTSLGGLGVSVSGSGYINASRTSGASGFFNRASTDGDIIGFYKDGTAVGGIGSLSGLLTVNQGNIGLIFNSTSQKIYPTDGATSVKDAAIDLGVSSSRFKDLYLSGGVNAAQINLTDGGGTLRNVLDLDGSSNLKVGTGSSVGTRAITFFTENAEKMRIDSSGNLLVGKTSADNTTVGFTIYKDNGYSVVRDSNPLGIYNRLTTNGDLMVFRKDGTTVGSIGSYAGAQTFITGGTTSTSGVVIGDNLFVPCTTNGNSLDNTVDLGSAGRRWQDVYATNGTIQTSDR